MATIQTTQGKIIDSFAALRKLSGADVKWKYSVPIGRTFDAVEPELNRLSEARSEVVRSHAERDDEGEIIYEDSDERFPKIENEEAFNAELEEFRNTEFELDAPLLPDLSGLEDLSMPPALARTLFYLMED